MAMSPTPLSEKERQRIVAALASGVPLKQLYQSGRFKGVSEKTMREIADAQGVQRQRCPPRSRKNATPTRQAEGR
jgi:hypothetical protein